MALYTIALPLTLLSGTAIAIAFRQGHSSLLNTGPHGLSEALYAFTSAANSNGSAFAGINANTTFYNTPLGMVMLLGRYLPMVLVLGLAGAFARQRPRPAIEGTPPTQTPFFVALVLGTVVLLTLLSFLAGGALGPLAEAFH